MALAWESTWIYIFLIYAGSCMELHETVERKVMVKTTGSDLQPAATGFIYKRDNNGPASVIKLDETQVMEQLTKLPEYVESEAYIAPISEDATSIYDKKDDSKKLTSETHVVPVVQRSLQGVSDDVDGLADEEYAKMFRDYSSDLEDYQKDFSDYLHGINHFHDSEDDTNKLAKGYDYYPTSDTYGVHEDKGYNSYETPLHEYEKGGAGDYNTQKHETFSVSGGGSHKKSYGDAYDSEAEKSSDDENDETGDKNDNNEQKTDKEEDEASDGVYKYFQTDEQNDGDDSSSREAFKPNHDEYGPGHFDYESGSYEPEKRDSDDEREQDDQTGFGEDSSHHQQHTYQVTDPNADKEPRQNTNGFLGTKRKNRGRIGFNYKIKH